LTQREYSLELPLSIRILCLLDDGGRKKKGLTSSEIIESLESNDRTTYDHLRSLLIKGMVQKEKMKDKTMYFIAISGTKHLENHPLKHLQALHNECYLEDWYQGRQ